MTPQSPTLAAPTPGFATQAVTFDVSATFDFDNVDGTAANDQTLQYLWDFGDGGTANTNR